LLTGYEWFDWAVSVPVNVVGVGINAISLPALKLRRPVSAVEGYPVIESL
jgi:hypothetical protein